MKYRNILLSISFLITVLTGCKDTSSNPVLDLNNLKWKADTLAYPGSYQTLMLSIWGTSARNIFTVGHNDRGSGTGWRFDGERWQSIDFRRDITWNSPDFEKVTGFSAQQIYAVGSFSLYNPNQSPGITPVACLLKYNGWQWKEEITMRDTTNLIDIHGQSEDNMWACGMYGALYNKTNGQWKRVVILEDFKKQKKINFDGVKTDGQNVYLFGINMDGWLSCFYILNNQGIIVYSSSFPLSEPQKWGNRLFLSKDKVLYSYGGGSIFRWSNNTWQRLYDNPYGLRDMTEINGNLVTVGPTGVILSNAGGSWNRITTPYDDPNNIYTGIWSDGKKIYITGMIFGADAQKTIVLTGE